MLLRVEKVRKSKRKQEIKTMYFSAFPKNDRMPFGMMVFLSYLWNTEFLAFYDADVLCGFVYMATVGRQTFIMFFAVDQSLRSKGYGSGILSAIQALHPKNKWIVSIEPCVASASDIEARLSRKRFYLRNGFAESGYFMKLGTEQEILTKNGAFDKRRFRLFFLLYSFFTLCPKMWKSPS